MRKQFFFNTTKNKIATKYKILLLVLFNVALNACNPSPETKEETTVQVTEPDKPKIPIVILEALKDESSYDMPRFQFQGYLEGREQKEIWSIKIDGSDLRLVLSAEELYHGGFSYLSPHMSRSPDGRYVALVQKPDEGSNARVLYDLKTRKRTVMVKNSAIIPSIRWTQDSKKVLFYSWSQKDSKSYLYEFDVNDKKLSKGPEVHSYEFYPIKNDSEFIAITKQGFARYNWAGKKLSEVKLVEQMDTWEHAISRNGELMIYQSNKPIDPAKIIKLDEPDKKVLLVKDRASNFMFDFKGENLYYKGFKGIFKIDLKTNAKSKIIEPLGYMGMLNLSLYNDKER